MENLARRKLLPLVKGVFTVMDLQKIADATRLLLEGLEVDLADHNFADTPNRVARAYAELFSPADVDIPVFDEKYTDMVMMRRHVFYTLCPHHLLPVKITASVAYVPNGKVIGASKLIRIMHDVNRFPMTQEALTNAVAARIRALTDSGSLGEAVFMIGEHGCFQIRGVRSHGTDMITTAFRGRFDRESGLRDTFLRLVS